MEQNLSHFFAMIQPFLANSIMSWLLLVEMNISNYHHAGHLEHYHMMFINCHYIWAIFVLLLFQLIQNSLTSVPEQKEHVNEKAKYWEWQGNVRTIYNLLDCI